MIYLLGGVKLTLKKLLKHSRSVYPNNMEKRRARRLKKKKKIEFWQFIVGTLLIMLLEYGLFWLWLKAKGWI